AGIVGVFKLVHLRGEGTLALKVAAGDVDLGADHAAIVDGLLEFQIGIGLDGAGGADAGNASGEVETREAAGVLGVESDAAPRRGVVHVVVHADQSGNHAIALQVDDLGAFGSGAAGLGDAGDLAVADGHGLVVKRGRAGSI